MFFYVYDENVSLVCLLFNKLLLDTQNTVTGKLRCDESECFARREV